MMKLLKIILLSTVVVLMSGCVSQPKQQLNPLDIQAMQTREYSEEHKVVFMSVVSVFQDLGYTVTNANMDTGLISAESITEDSINFLSIFSGYSSNMQVKATAFVEKIKKSVKVRLSFVEIIKDSSGYGQNSRKDRQLLDVKLYEGAFDKIENAIFVRKAD